MNAPNFNTQAEQLDSEPISIDSVMSLFEKYNVSNGTRMTVKKMLTRAVNDVMLNGHSNESKKELCWLTSMELATTACSWASLPKIDKSQPELTQEEKATLIEACYNLLDATASEHAKQNDIQTAEISDNVKSFINLSVGR